MTAPETTVDRARLRFALLGPGYPHRGGIAQYTTLLHQELASCHEVRHFSLTRQYPSLLFPGKTQLDESCQAIAAPTIPCLDSMNPFTWFSTAGLIREFAPDLTVLMWWQPFFGPSLGTVSRLLERRGLPTAFLCHNVAPHEGSLVDRLLTRWAFARARAFVLHAEVDRAALGELRQGAAVVVNPHPAYEQFIPGRRIDQLEARRRLGLRGSRVLLFFGLIRAYKGVRTLLTAFARLAGDPELELVVAGECYEPEGEYRRLIEELGIVSRVRFVNRFIPNEEVAPYFAACDLVVLPYHTASQSGVVQIAYAMERPVLATRVGGLPEVIFEGETGLLVPPLDADALAGAVREFFARGGLETFRQGIAARRDLFAWSRMRRKLETLAGGCR
ncbi:MAG: glycosyltransferase [Candidatus Riflebacteria bacterium]|nr:glycosyltransferase [Candidatus Riflebacteria bacterium]